MKRMLFIVTLLVIMLASVACAAAATPAPPAQEPETIEVVVTSIVEVTPEGGGEVTTETITETVEVVVTATPAPVEEITFNAEDPETYIATTFGDPETFDPALNYETAGASIIAQTYETLVTYNRQVAAELVPQLATEMPEVSEDGTVYTFTIREGITFHEGGELTAEDVAYSFQRGLLQGGGSSPQLLLTEPILGVGVYDISEVLFADLAESDPEAYGASAYNPEAVAGADPAALEAVCQQVKDAIVADGNTVTFTLAQAWEPFLPTLAGGWGSIMDQEWVVENGGWDGECATWAASYGISSENSPFTPIINGTGPYALDRWTPGEEVVLVANENYWRTEEVGPAWENGPTGVAALKTVVIQSVDEWGTRFAGMQAGDADSTVVPRENISQIDPLVGEICTYNFDTLDFDCAASESPDGPFRLYTGSPDVTRSDMMFTWNINVDGGNALVGSGALDGNGIPPDFFSDINVRRGFAHCMDWDILIDDVYNGEAIQNVGVVIPGMLGYNEEGSRFSFDPEVCESELATAWGGVLPETGFRLQVAYNTGNTTRQTVAQILQTNLAAINENYIIEVVGLPWPNFLRNQREGRLPIFISGWHQDINDPHNWVQPFLVGVYAQRMGLPEELTAQFKALIDAAVVESDPDARQAQYEEISELDYENVVGVRLVLPGIRRYEQRWVEGWYYNPQYTSPFYYALSKN